MKYNQLRIVMTDGICNMHCAYCIAGYSSKEKQAQSDYINQEQMLLTIGSDTFNSISIWGGEPFCQSAKLQNAVKFCAQRFPGTPIMIVSNGSALTRENIDFIKKYGLNITLSHDGAAQFLRGFDYLSDANRLELVAELDNIAFTSVLHHDNCDLAELFDYFAKIAIKINRQTFWGFELFQLSAPAAIRFLPHGYRLIQFAHSLDWALNEFKQGNPLAYTALHRTLMTMAVLIDGNYAATIRCAANKRLTITTNGDKAFCQVQAERNNFAYPSLVLPKMCLTCEVARFCAGICPNITDAYRKKMCAIYKLYYSKLYRFLLGLDSRKKFVG